MQAIDELEADLGRVGKRRRCPATTDYLLFEVEPYFEGIRAMRGEE